VDKYNIIDFPPYSEVAVAAWVTTA
jgi:hypothetical protein